jgi:hypothetical protein
MYKATRKCSYQFKFCSLDMEIKEPACWGFKDEQESPMCSSKSILSRQKLDSLDRRFTGT